MFNIIYTCQHRNIKYFFVHAWNWCLIVMNWVTSTFVLVSYGTQYIAALDAWITSPLHYFLIVGMSSIRCCVCVQDYLHVSGQLLFMIPSTLSITNCAWARAPARFSFLNWHVLIKKPFHDIPEKNFSMYHSKSVAKNQRCLSLYLF